MVKQFLPVRLRVPAPSLALVTGATSGIGYALCEVLASEGIRLIISGRHLVQLEKAAQVLRLKVSVETAPADLSTSEGRQALVKIIRQQAPDLIINNAGFALYNEAINYTTEQQMQILEVNGVALLELSLEAAKAMEKANKTGVIMNVSSVAAFFTFPYFSVYAASKSFVNKLSYSLDYELRSKGIRVLVACPGMVDTNFRIRAGGNPAINKKGIMTSQFAAEQIWKQIKSLKTINVFNWKYRLAVFFRHFIPSFISIKILANNIKKRCQ
ncbi:SDR family NAD(P)-dependent oxidoreductase [Neochlamydia sp. AcF65]|uniref:SDR family NAD(P)-dependent oxidoreductase n=1 Tax=Neochlamydia sp. AcF65 TaxID=2795735 RepID=UPI001BC8E020|nr:SDR family NAD(P)-dependent oxidoreductase [Neochlamydia sp. AcF65]